MDIVISGDFFGLNNELMTLHNKFNNIQTSKLTGLKGDDICAIHKNINVNSYVGT